MNRDYLDVVLVVDFMNDMQTSPQLSNICVQIFRSNVMSSEWSFDFLIVTISGGDGVYILYGALQSDTGGCVSWKFGDIQFWS